MKNLLLLFSLAIFVSCSTMDEKAPVSKTLNIEHAELDLSNVAKIIIPNEPPLEFQVIDGKVQPLYQAKIKNLSFDDVWFYDADGAEVWNTYLGYFGPWAGDYWTYEFTYLPESNTITMRQVVKQH